jgi:hypothetical protein
MAPLGPKEKHSDKAIAVPADLHLSRLSTVR